MSTKEAQPSFDPLADIKSFLYVWYSNGKLSVGLLGVVFLYNFVFFDYPQGYQLYLIVPVVGYVALFFTQFWNNSQNRRILNIATIFLFISAGIDLLVSASYVFGGDSFQNLGIFPLLGDFLAILVFFGWRYNFKTKREELPEIQNSDLHEEN